MDINVETHADCTASLKATVPAEETAKQRQAIISNYQAQAKIPGFRPGKVPARTIEKRFASAIAEELTAHLFDQVCSETLQQNPNLKVLNFGKPEQNIDETGAYSLTTVMTIVPDFELPEYKGLQVTVGPDQITDEELDKAMNDLAERMSDFSPVERPAQKGDVAIINFTSTMDGKPVAEAVGKPVGFIEGRDNQWMPIEEDGFLPGLTDGIIGMSAGDAKDIQVTIPEQFPITDLQNKNITFHVTASEIRERVTPEINEEFAEKIMPGKTVEEIRDLMKADLERRKKTENDNLKADQITEQLAQAIDFALPETLIESESYGIVQRKMQELIYSGTPQDQLETKMEEIRAEAKTEAAKNLKVYFMLQEIAAKENIHVSDQELGVEIMQQAERAKKSPKAYVRELQREGRMHGIRMSLLTAKVLDFLVKESKV